MKTTVEFISNCCGNIYKDKPLINRILTLAGILCIPIIAVILYQVGYYYTIYTEEIDFNTNCYITDLVNKSVDPSLCAISNCLCAAPCHYWLGCTIVGLFPVGIIACIFFVVVFIISIIMCLKNLITDICEKTRLNMEQTAIQLNGYESTT